MQEVLTQLTAFWESLKTNQAHGDGTAAIHLLDVVSGLAQLVFCF